MQLTVTTHERPAHVDTWAAQLGWVGGTGAEPSWGFELDADEFARAVHAAVAAGCDTHTGDPEWVGYWSFPIRDPMGNTIEQSTPDRDAWASDSSGAIERPLSGTDPAG